MNKTEKVDSPTDIPEPNFDRKLTKSWNYYWQWCILNG